MSPSWRNRFEIALCRDEIAVRHIAAGWRPKEEIVVEQTRPEDLPHSLGEILDRIASQQKSRIGSVAEITFSESFVRHALLPWSPLVRGKSDRAALLGACFEDTYGEAALEWHLVADRGEYALSAPACGVEQTLLAQIAAVLTPRRIQLQSATPFFSAVFNRYRLVASQRPTVLAAGDSEWTTMATFVEGRWNSLRSVRLTGNPDEFPAVLTREAVLQGLPAEAHKLLCTPIEVQSHAPANDIEFLHPWGTLSKPQKSVALLSGCWPQ